MLFSAKSQATAEASITFVAADEQAIAFQLAQAEPHVVHPALVAQFLEFAGQYGQVAGVLIGGEVPAFDLASGGELAVACLGVFRTGWVGSRTSGAGLASHAQHAFARRSEARRVGRGRAAGRGGVAG